MIVQTMVTDEAIKQQLLREVAVMHQRLRGVPPLTAEMQFILEAQELDGYGREYYPVKVSRLLLLLLLLWIAHLAMLIYFTFIHSFIPFIHCIGLPIHCNSNLPIIAVFVEYLRQFLIDLNQIYRHSSVP